MTRPSRRIMLLLFLSCVPAAAETLQRRSVNGNVTCLGDGGVSCQTVNGRITCVGEGGSVMQESGGKPRRDQSSQDLFDEADATLEMGLRERPLPPTHRLAIDRHGPAGTFSAERHGTRLRLRTEQLAIDRD